jgi:hypothetical protein
MYLLQTMIHTFPKFATLFLFLSLISFSHLCAQNVNHPIGSDVRITDIQKSDDLLILRHSFGNVGKPFLGADTLDIANKVLLGSRDTITGLVNDQLILNDGTKILGGSEINVNGVKMKSPLVFIDPSGRIDTSRMINLSTIFKNNSGNIVNGPATISSLALVSDTLYIAGNFHTVNDKDRMCAASIDLSTNKVTDWDLKSNHSDETHLKKIQNKIYFYGNFTQIAGAYSPNLISLNLKTLKTKIINSPNNRVQSIIRDSTHWYLNGTEKIGLPASKMLISNDLTFKNNIGLPFIDKTINGIVADDVGGYYVAGDFYYISDTSLPSTGLAYIDSNLNVSKLPNFNYWYGTVYQDVVLFGDTLVVSSKNSSSSNLTQQIFYYNIKTKQIVPPPFEVILNTEITEPTLEKIDKQFCLIKEPTSINGQSISGNILVNIKTGEWNWLPRGVNHTIIDDTCYFANSSSQYNQVGYTVKNFGQYRHGKMAPKSISYSYKAVGKIISDQNGGYYLASSISDPYDTEKIIHILPNGLEDTSFTCRVSLGHVADLALYGDTLFVGGFNNYRIYSSVKLFNVKTKNWITSSLKVNGPTRDLELKGDTLFIAGDIDSVNGSLDYQNLCAIDAKTLSPITWAHQLNAEVASIVVENDFIYVLGHFDSCSGRKITHLARFKMNNLKVDTSFGIDVVTHTSSYYHPDYTVLKKNKNKLYIGGRFQSTTYNGKIYTGIIQYDINTDSLTDLDLISGQFTTVNDIEFRDDTMYIGGRFDQILGQAQSNFATISLNDTSLIESWIKPNNDILCILADDSLTSVGGDFTTLGSMSGDYFKYSIKSKEYLLRKNNNLHLKNLAIVDENLFGFSYGRTVNGFEHNGLYKYDLTTDSLLPWNSNFVPYNTWHDDYGIKNINDSLFIYGSTNANYAIPHLLQNEQYLAVLDTDSGKLHTIKALDGQIKHLSIQNNKIMLTGTFSKLNNMQTHLAKFDFDDNMDYTFRDQASYYSLNGFSKNVVIGDTFIWAASNGNIYRINKLSGKYIRKFEGLSNPDLHIIDSLLYVTGVTSEFRISYPQYSYELGASSFAYNLHTKKIDTSTLKFSGTIPNFRKSGKYYISSASQTSLVKPIYSNLTVYNTTTDNYKKLDLNPGYALNEVGASFIKDDKLYIERFYNKYQRKNEIVEYDLKADSITHAIPSNGEGSMILVHDSLIIKVFYSQMIIQKRHTGDILTSTPEFNNSINSIVIKDSLAYIGGAFSRVNGNNVYGLTKMNLNTFKIIPFAVPYEQGCSVSDLIINGSQLLISGINVEPRSTSFSIFSVLDLETESLDPYRPELNISSGYASSSFVHKNLLFVNYLDYANYRNATKIFDLITGEESHQFDQFDLAADNFIFANGGLWAYGTNSRVTTYSQHHIVQIMGDYYDTDFYVEDYTPDSMAIGRDATMTIQGYGFTENTRFWLRNNTDTLYPVDSSITRERNGYILTGHFVNIDVPVGLYDLMVNEPGDTLVKLADAVFIDTARFDGISVSLNGRDTIRPLTPVNYTIELTNHSNFDLKNVPVFIAASGLKTLQIREKVKVGDSIEFDASDLYIDIDSLSGDTFTAQMASLLIPKIPANGKTKISFRIESQNTVDQVNIRIWYHAPLQDDDSISNIILAYTDLLQPIDSMCLDSVIRNKINSNISQNYLAINRRLLMYNLKSWLSEIVKECNSSLNVDSMLKSLTPEVPSHIKKWSLDSVSISHFKGEYAFINSVAITKDIVIVNSLDPNIKIGYKGYGNNNHTTQIPKELYYEIHFENDSSASAPVQKLIILDTLNKDMFDIKSVVFSELALSDDIIQFNGYNREINKIYDINTSNNYKLDVKASVDTASGVLSCTVIAIDKYTGTIEQLGPFEGFLPPNKDGQNGNGYLSFYVNRLDGVEQISNEAGIIFDNNERILTPPWNILKDEIAPTSELFATLDTVAKQINIEWQGEDNTNGSGVYDYTIYWSTDNTTFNPLLTSSTLTEYSLNLINKPSYYFYSIASDAVGNREEKEEYDDMITSNHLSITKVADNQIVVYPNPSQGTFMFRLPSKEIHTLLISDIRGSEISRTQITSGNSISLATSGIYIATVLKKNERIGTLKLIVK